MPEREQMESKQNMVQAVQAGQLMAQDCTAMTLIMAMESAFSGEMKRAKSKAMYHGVILKKNLAQ